MSDEFGMPITNTSVQLYRNTSTREKVIRLSDDAGFSVREANEYHDDQVIDSGNNWITERLTTFYHAAIADFLKSSGLYVTNDLTRKYALKEARNEAYDKWKEDYALAYEPNYSKATEEDCRAAYKAGYLSLLNELELGDWCRDSDNAPLYALPEGVTKS